MKRNPLAKGQIAGLSLKRSDLGANRSALVVFKSVGRFVKARISARTLAQNACPWQWQNRNLA
jgi:hypothetical protein